MGRGGTQGCLHACMSSAHLIACSPTNHPHVCVRRRPTWCVRASPFTPGRPPARPPFTPQVYGLRDELEVRVGELAIHAYARVGGCGTLVQRLQARPLPEQADTAVWSRQQD